MVGPSLSRRPRPCVSARPSGRCLAVAVGRHQATRRRRRRGRASLFRPRTPAHRAGSPRARIPYQSSPTATASLFGTPKAGATAARACPRGRRGRRARSAAPAPSRPQGRTRSRPRSAPAARGVRTMQNTATTTDRLVEERGDDARRAPRRGSAAEAVDAHVHRADEARPVLVARRSAPRAVGGPRRPRGSRPSSSDRGDGDQRARSSEWSASSSDGFEREADEHEQPGAR